MHKHSAMKVYKYYQLIFSSSYREDQSTSIHSITEVNISQNEHISYYRLYNKS